VVRRVIGGRTSLQVGRVKGIHYCISILGVPSDMYATCSFDPSVTKRMSLAVAKTDLSLNPVNRRSRNWIPLEQYPRPILCAITLSYCKSRPPCHMLMRFMLLSLLFFPILRYSSSIGCSRFVGSHMRSSISLHAEM
jgi:hypothetical protein